MVDRATRWPRPQLPRGAHVRLVSANVDLPNPAGVDVLRVETAAELSEAVLRVAESAEVVVMAAAVADFRPTDAAAHKIKKGDRQPPPIALTRNDDVLSELVARKPTTQVLVGFAARPRRLDGWLEHGRRKLAAKGLTSWW